MENTVTKNIAIVLVGPKHSGNIGSVARCAKNMGMKRIIVVNPRQIDIDEMKKMSTHLASDVVDSIEYEEDLKRVLSPFQFIVGTTARRGSSSLRSAIISSKDAGTRIIEMSRYNRVALLFGSEDRGLTNNDIKYCDMLVNIPTSKGFSSINLSHAVMIVCYEIFSAVIGPGQKYAPRLAASSEIEAMYDNLEDMFLKIDLIRDESPGYWMAAVRRFFSRRGLLSKEVKIIRGICRQIDLFGQGMTSGGRKNKNA
ncbi:MAG: RNA methyltransferase [Syntrophales bacterium]|jgi:tRNA/rRNA methyltransferase|nr:RNA methyltransferase [Syntrophales bacterium]MDY0044534.1 RNA methyltransferase [Syntrophales bacterium]